MPHITVRGLLWAFAVVLLTTAWAALMGNSLLIAMVEAAVGCTLILWLLFPQNLPTARFMVCSLLAVVLAGSVGTYWWLRLTPEPKVSFYFPQQRSNYAPGMEIHGLRWDENYRAYRFVVETETSSAVIHDLSAKMYLLGVVVTHAVKHSERATTVRVYQDKESLGPVLKSESDVITEAHDYDSNELNISIDELRPGGKAEIEIVVDYSDLDQEKTKTKSGGVFVAYTYEGLDWKGIKKHTITKESFRLFVADPDAWTYTISRSEPGKKYAGTIAFRFKTPLVFKGPSGPCTPEQTMSEACPQPLCLSPH